MPHILDGERHLRATEGKTLYFWVIGLPKTVPTSAYWPYLTPSPWEQP
jgi:hypothetical protein